MSLYGKFICFLSLFSLIQKNLAGNGDESLNCLNAGTVEMAKELIILDGFVDELNEVAFYRFNFAIFQFSN